MMNLTRFLKKETTSSKQDKYICKAVLNGKPEYFSVLVSKYQKRIYSLGLSFFKNHDDAEDFVQDVMLKTFSALPKFRGDSAFSTWLMRIAYNTAINAINRKKEFVSAFEDFQISSTELTPEEWHIQSCIKASIRKAINELPEKCRICIDLYFFYQMPYADIATITNIPINTIKSHIFRSKKILKTELEREGICGKETSQMYPVFFRLNLAYDM